MKIKKVSMKTFRSNPLYCSSLLRHGNAKLKDEKATEERKAIKYMQYNLPALSTCPYASSGCKKFCYAKRDERYTNVKNSRERAFNNSKCNDFVNRMIYTISVELKSRRYNNATTLLRLHESGDFYNQEYFNKWLEIAHAFIGKDINIHAYTKCFKYVLALDNEHKALFVDILKSGTFTLNLSLDDTTTIEQLKRAEQIKSLYPLVNIYYATATIDKSLFDSICDCANCGDCRKCSTSNGTKTAVLIH